MMGESAEPTATVQQLRPRSWRLVTGRTASGLWSASCRGVTGGAVCNASTEAEALQCLAEILAMRRLPGVVKRLGWTVDGSDHWEAPILWVRSPDGTRLALGVGVRMAVGSGAAKHLGRPDPYAGTPTLVIPPAHVLDAGLVAAALDSALRRASLSRGPIVG